jgi:hypothetical protein
LVTAKEGPSSLVFVHLTVIIRALPFASQGLAKEPDPVEPLGQSCCGSGGLEATGDALADAAGAGSGGAVAALAEADADAAGAGAACSLEQLTTTSIAAVVERAVRIMATHPTTSRGRPPPRSVRAVELRRDGPHCRIGRRWDRKVHRDGPVA